MSFTETKGNSPTKKGTAFTLFMDENTLKTTLIENIRSVIELEALSLERIAADGIDESYYAALKLIYHCKGKVVLTGVGKSGLIARKIAATMASTGTLAVFMHPTEAMHGDLGMVSHGDVIIAIGKSGESDEVNALIPAIRNMKVPIIALTSRRDSTLSKAADINLHIPVEREACPLDLAPTVSTTVTLAVGDAIAVTLMKMKNFKSEDFARSHPGGKLGRRLLLKVSDIMVAPTVFNVLNPTTATIKDTIVELARSGLGIVLFSENTRTLAGMLTDGDIRNLLNQHDEGIFKLRVGDVINKNPHTIPMDWLAVEALEFMENRPKPLNVVPVLDESQLVGVARLHDLINLS